MPTYVYRRADGSKFELFQSITADPLTKCPDTEQPVQRVITGGTGFILKGSGFYKTDYVNSAPEESKNGAKADKDGAEASDKAPEKADAKAEAKAEVAADSD